MYNHLFFTNILRILERMGGHERTTLENISGIYIIYFRFI